MPTSRRSLAMGLLASTLAASGSLATDVPPPRVGATAPTFAAPDLDGKIVSLADLKGRTVVLEWTNPECPWVAKHYVGGNMQALQAYAVKKGVVWLTVSSADRGQVGYLDDLEAAALFDQRKSKATHMLLDHSGRMLADYGVAVALTLAVIAADGRLAYYGAIDDQPNARPEDLHLARNYVRGAIDALDRGELPSPAQTRAYGCAAR